jgi:5-deoxy-glucuronate isomerase
MTGSTRWLHRRGDLARDGWESVVDDTLPGWQHTGLRIGVLDGSTALELPAGALERMVVPLEGTLTVTHDGGEDAEGPTGAQSTIELAHRIGVFHGPGDVVYLGVGVTATISGTGRVAVAEAPATEQIPVQVIRAADVPVEQRGAGASSRQVHNFGVPGGLRAQKLIVCEVITPSENWSSFPAHKHDQAIPGVESRLEEIYYFESDVARGLARPEQSDPFGLFATYSSPAGEIDIAGLVRTGDVALVPYGYHGPAAAAPGYDLYYFNVMAGPDPERVWNITDDPAHGWIRGTWDGQERDTRLPYTSAPVGDEPGATSAGAGAADSTTTTSTTENGL